uniref:Uncharacterized protein n=1 Tax=Anguilla anguilla TaxID=7936 RepID=A0A0E9SKI8_ANGAN
MIHWVTQCFSKPLHQDQPEGESQK